MEDFFNKVKVASESARKEFEEKGQPAIEEWWKSAQKGVQQMGKDISDSIQREKERAGGLADPITRGPPSEAELRRLDLCYITDRVIASSFPVDGRLPQHALPRHLPDNGKYNSLAVMSAHLRHKHAGKFMIWNVSEESYDYSAFNNQVLVFSFPGHPSPPLGMLFNICTSIENWLAADNENVALVHCLNGMGRTATILACFLAWVGDTSSPQDGLQWVADSKGIPVERLTVPSQRRYLQYFSSVLDGQRPTGQVLVLKRVIMNPVPNFIQVPPRLDGRQTGADQQQQPLCRPYLQLFKDGTRLFSSAPTIEAARPNNNDVKQKEKAGSSQDHSPQGKTARPQWIYESDMSISFHMEFPLRGDILLRGRHIQSNGKRVSMFRTAFHTGYISGGVLRLTKADLDGANVDPRFTEDFFIDLVFSVVESQGSSGVGVSPVTSSTTRKGRSITSSPLKKEKNALMMDSAVNDVNDGMLLRDVQFWEGIKERKACRRSNAAMNDNTPRRSPVLSSLQQPRGGLDGTITSPPGTAAPINTKKVIKQEQEQPIPSVPTCNKFRINAEADEMTANLTDHEATNRDRNLLAELAALEELEIVSDNGDDDSEANHVSECGVVSGGNGSVTEPDRVAHMTSPLLQTDGAAIVIDKGNEREEEQDVSPPLSCSSEDATSTTDNLLTTRELDELEQELSLAMTLERLSHSDTESKGNSFAQLCDDDEDERPDLDDDILKELESCLEGIKSDNTTD